MQEVLIHYRYNKLRLQYPSFYASRSKIRLFINLSNNMLQSYLEDSQPADSTSKYPELEQESLTILSARLLTEGRDLCKFTCNAQFWIWSAFNSLHSEHPHSQSSPCHKVSSSRLTFTILKKLLQKWSIWKQLTKF